MATLDVRRIWRADPTVDHAVDNVFGRQRCSTRIEAFGPARAMFDRMQLGAEALVQFPRVLECT